MALKEYEWLGHTYQFEEGEQPEGAKPKAAPKRRAAAANKAKEKPTDKGAR